MTRGWVWPILGGLIALLPLWWPVWILTDHGNWWIGPPPLALFIAGAMGIVCAFVARSDPAAAFFGAYVLIRTLAGSPPTALVRSVIIVAGLGLYALVRSGVGTRQAVQRLLLVVGLVQLPLLGAQVLGWLPAGWAGGTFGNSNFCGAWLAISLALVPVWAVPAWLASVALSRSLLAAIAATAAVFLRFRAHSWVWWAASGTLAATALMRGIDLTSWAHRWAAWSWGAQTLAGSPVFGIGVDGWAQSRVLVRDGATVGEWSTAHNEPLQLAVEVGLVGVALVGWWLWRHRAIWRGREAPSLIALAIESVAMFPFQVPAVAILAVTVLGLAARAEDP